MEKAIAYPTSMKLTMKKARELAMQELGTARGLKKLEGYPPSWYCMELGSLLIRIFPDTIGRSGCIVLAVGLSGTSGEVRQFHDADTLEQDFKAGDRYSEQVRKDIIEEWVSDHGPEDCHKRVDEIWEGP